MWISINLTKLNQLIIKDENISNHGYIDILILRIYYIHRWMF